MNGLNLMQSDVQISMNATYHLPSVDITYLSGFQHFHYVLAIPNQAVAGTDAGVISFQESGRRARRPALLCTAAGNSLASCETPLTINPTPNYLTFDEFDQSFSNELDFTSTRDSPFQYIGGLYWYREIWNQPVNAFTTPAQLQMGRRYTITLLSVVTEPAQLRGRPIRDLPRAAATRHAPARPRTRHITYDSYAAFLQASYKFSDQWKITAGFRWTRIARWAHRPGGFCHSTISSARTEAALETGAARRQRSTSPPWPPVRRRQRRFASKVSRRRPDDDQRLDGRSATQPERHLERADRRRRSRVDA